MPSSLGYNIEQRILLAKERRRSVQLHMMLLSHSSKCSDVACPSENCAKMKALLRHVDECKAKAGGGCDRCKRAWALLHLHARQCRLQQHANDTNPLCQVPHCFEIGKKYHHVAAVQTSTPIEPQAVKKRIVSFDLKSDQSS